MLIARDDKELFLHEWSDGQNNVAVCLIHGMSEHGGRYRRWGEFLNSQGISLYTYDQRGHGKSLTNRDTVGFIDHHEAWEKIVDDAASLIDYVHNKGKYKSLILMGHSFGALVATAVSQQKELPVEKLILSSMPEHQPLLSQFGKIISQVQSGLLGGKSDGRIQTELTFGVYNKRFKPNRTPFDWISSVEEEVDEYVNDPKCGELLTVNFYLALAKGIREVYHPNSIDKLPAQRPLLIFAGSEDPVSGGVKGIANSSQRLGKRVIDQTTRVFENGRHEMLNEYNREEVMEFIVSWINQSHG